MPSFSLQPGKEEEEKREEERREEKMGEERRRGEKRGEEGRGEERREGGSFISFNKASKPLPISGSGWTGNEDKATGVP